MSDKPMTANGELNAESARALAADAFTINEIDSLLAKMPYAKVGMMNVWQVPNDGYVHIHVSHMPVLNLIKRYPLALMQLREALARIEALEAAAREREGDL